MTQLDRRTNKRFTPDENAYAVLVSDSSTLGEIIDVSDNGLSFKYLQFDETIPSPERLGILVAGHNFMIHNIPFDIVSEKTIAGNYIFSTSTMKRCCIKFGKMDDTTQTMLNYFINKHTTKRAES